MKNSRIESENRLDLESQAVLFDSIVKEVDVQQLDLDQIQADLASISNRKQRQISPRIMSALYAPSLVMSIAAALVILWLYLGDGLTLAQDEDAEDNVASATELISRYYNLDGAEQVKQSVQRHFYSEQEILDRADTLKSLHLAILEATGFNLDSTDLALLDSIVGQQFTGLTLADFVNHYLPIKNYCSMLEAGAEVGWYGAEVYDSPDTPEPRPIISGLTCIVDHGETMLTRGLKYPEAVNWNERQALDGNQSYSPPFYVIGNDNPGSVNTYMYLDTERLPGSKLSSRSFEIAEGALAFEINSSFLNTVNDLIYNTVPGLCTFVGFANGYYTYQLADGNQIQVCLRQGPRIENSYEDSLTALWNSLAMPAADRPNLGCESLNPNAVTSWMLQNSAGEPECVDVKGGDSTAYMRVLDRSLAPEPDNAGTAVAVIASVLALLGIPGVITAGAKSRSRRQEIIANANTAITAIETFLDLDNPDAITATDNFVRLWNNRHYHGESLANDNVLARTESLCIEKGICDAATLEEIITVLTKLTKMYDADVGLDSNPLMPMLREWFRRHRTDEDAYRVAYANLQAKLPQLHAIPAPDNVFVQIDDSAVAVEVPIEYTAAIVVGDKRINMVTEDMASIVTELKKYDPTVSQKRGAIAASENEIMRLLNACRKEDGSLMTIRHFIAVTPGGRSMLLSDHQSYGVDSMVVSYQLNRSDASAMLYIYYDFTTKEFGFVIDEDTNLNAMTVRDMVLEV